MSKRKKAFSLVEVTIVLSIFAIIISITLVVSDFSMRNRRRELYLQKLKLMYKELTLWELKEYKIQDKTDEGMIVIYDNDGNMYYGTISDNTIVKVEYSDAELAPDYSLTYSNSIGFHGNTALVQEYNYLIEQMKEDKITYFWI